MEIEKGLEIKVVQKCLIMMANRREKFPVKSNPCVVCGWKTHFLHTLLIRWCRTQHARTPTPVPPRHLLKSLNYIQKKKLWDKAGTGKDIQLPQQSCGSVTSTWIPSSELKQLRLRAEAELSSLVLTEMFCSDCRGWGDPLPAGHEHRHTHSLGPPPCATEHPRGTRKHPALFLCIFKV